MNAPVPHAMPAHGHRPGPRPNLPARLRRWRSQNLPLLKPRAQQPKRNLTMVLREYHKRFGIFAFIFMGWLGFSGVLMNQSVSWGLDAKRIDWGWLMAMYGLHAEAPQTGFVAGSHWLAATSEYTLIDGKPLDQQLPPVLGLAQGGAPNDPLLFVASSTQVAILGPDGSVVDTLQDYTLPVSTVRRIGITDESPPRVAIQDLDVYATVDGLDWQALPATASITWVAPAELSAARQQQILPYTRPSMPLEQVLIDAHSGRLFGRFGPWVINCVGLSALALSITGIWMMRRLNQARNKNKRGKSAAA